MSALYRQRCRATQRRRKAAKQAPNLFKLWRLYHRQWLVIKEMRAKGLTGFISLRDTHQLALRSALDFRIEVLRRAASKLCRRLFTKPVTLLTVLDELYPPAAFEHTKGEA